MAKKKKPLTRQQLRQQKRRQAKNKKVTPIVEQNKPVPTRLLAIIGIIAILLIGGFYIYKSMDNVPIKEPVFRHDGRLSLIGKDSSNLTEIEIEIVEQPADIEQGLMYRKSMAANRGMLFDMPVEQPHSFWMKNTYIPLDIVYISSSGDIVSMQTNTTPLSEKTLPSVKPAKYVLEVNAGFMQKHGYRIGDKVLFTRDKPPT